MSFSFLLHDSFEESEYDERGEIERTDGDKHSVWPHVFITEVVFSFHFTRVDVSSGFLSCHVCYFVFAGFASCYFT